LTQRFHIFILQTDGIDRLISTNKIRPLKLIGIHSSSSNRYEEYVQGGNDNEQFKKHQKFVYSEVINSVEKETENWEGKKYLYGVSNGAAFSMHAGLNYPHLFEEIIAFSTADYISSIARMMNPITFNFDKYPKFYMGAGRYEKLFFNDNIKFFDKMKSNEIEVEFKEFISGHDDNVWRIEFLEYIEKRFKI
jgi:enterochelin esterase-like enzyme